MPKRRPKPRPRGRTRGAVRAAAARAVERVLSSKESFALLIHRLEQAGWHIERPVTPEPHASDEGLTPPARAR